MEKYCYIKNNFLKFMRKFLWKSDKDHNRNGDAKLCKMNRKNSIWKIWKFVSRSYENYTIFPENLKILKIRVRSMRH